MNWYRKKGKGAAAKMGNEPSVCALNHSHASKLESSVCQVLQLRREAGDIQDIQVQDHVYLSLARIHSIPDFKCTDAAGTPFWVEAKGFPNMKWPIVKKLWAFYGPGRLEIWTGNWKSPQLTEQIVPKDIREKT